VTRGGGDDRPLRTYHGPSPGRGPPAVREARRRQRRRDAHRQARVHATPADLTVGLLNLGRGGWASNGASVILLGIEKGAHVLILSEAHVAAGSRIDVPPLLTSGRRPYEVLFSPRGLERAGGCPRGGVLILARRDSVIRRVELERVCDCADSLWVRLELIGAAEPVFVNGSYYPPTGASSCEREGCGCALSHRSTSLLRNLEHACKLARDGTVLIGGDLNVHLERSNECPWSRCVLDMLAAEDSTRTRLVTRVAYSTHLAMPAPTRDQAGWTDSSC